MDNTNKCLDRLCGGWVPNDPLVTEAIKYIESIGGEVWADKSNFDRTRVTEKSMHSVGSTFYIHFPNVNSWICSCGRSYPKIDIWWQPKNGVRFEHSGDGLQQAIDWVLSQS